MRFNRSAGPIPGVVLRNNYSETAMRHVFVAMQVSAFHTAGSRLDAGQRDVQPD